MKDRRNRHLLALLTDNFDIAFPRKKWLLLLVLYFSIATPILFLSGYSSKELGQTSFHYVFSAQAQTLGTILALVFTFTLVTAQLVTRYSHLLLQRVLAPWTFWYAIPFLIGIIAPLFLLNGDFALWAARLTLLLGGMCIILLIPFFVAVRRQLSMANVIDDLRDCIYKSDSDDQAANAVKSMSAISMGASILKDYETFNLGIESLGEASQLSENSERILMIAIELRNLVSRSGNDQVAMETLVHMLNRITLNIGKREDAEINRKMLKNLADAYENLSASFLCDLVDDIKTVKDLGIEETANPDNGVTRECQKVMHTVGKVIITERYIEEGLSRVVINALGDIAYNSIIMSANDAIDNIIMASIRLIEDLGSLAIRNKRIETTESSIEQLRRIAEAIGDAKPDILRATLAAMASLEGSMGE